ncbi:DUF5304 domain-containing protein [Streptomyces sp. NPDC097619]|uniref:DUF5304 domain-containing protein n=1 Tax=Streptomyces sp. NPDC097619 TaxID=3157228 RepID=UPI00332AA021
MSEATDRPTDEDAWARACAEDLAAEQARRRADRAGHEEPTGSAAEELLKLVDAVTDRMSALNNPLFGAVAQEAVRSFVTQAKTAVEPVIERNPQVFDHLAAAGSELLAAYRSAVEGHERRWTRGAQDPARPAGGPAPTPADGPDKAPGAGTDKGDGPDDPDPGRTERIDLD